MRSGDGEMVREFKTAFLIENVGVDRQRGIKDGLQVFGTQFLLRIMVVSPEVKSKFRLNKIYRRMMFFQ